MSVLFFSVFLYSFSGKCFSVFLYSFSGNFKQYRAHGVTPRQLLGLLGLTRADGRPPPLAKVGVTLGLRYQ